MPIDPALRHLLAHFRKSPSWDRELDLEVLRQLWPSLVGRGLAAATSVTAIQGTRVVVNVPDQVWRKQLAGIKRQLLAKVNEPWTTPWIEDIVFTYEN